MTSTSRPPWPRQERPGLAGRTSVQLDAREQRLPNAVTADVVDDLAPEPALAVDHDRAAQVDGEVLELVGGADDAEDLRLRRATRARASPRRRRRSRPRSRRRTATASVDRQGDDRVVDRVQPVEQGLVGLRATSA